MRVFVGILWLAMCALMVASVATVRPGGPIDSGEALILGTVAFSFGSVGAILVFRLPGNLIGWLLATIGLAIAAGIGTGGLADLGLNVHPGAVPGAIWFAWLTQWAAAPVTALVAGFLPLLYPTGHLPSRRWRPLAILAGLSIATTICVNAVGPFSPGVYPPGTENPLLIGGPVSDALSLANGVLALLGIPSLILVLASVVSRYRRAAGIERQQLKWFAAVASIVIAAFAVGITTQGSPNGTMAAAVSSLAYGIALTASALMPLAIGMAVLRYRLYDIDVVIRRTAVYVPLTAVLAGVYAATIGLLQRVFIAATGGPSDGAVILSTLILATTFTPIKNALQGAVDRRFRDAQDIERRLGLFSEGVANALAIDPARAMRAFLRVAVDASGAAGGAAYLAIDGGERLVGETRTRRDGPAVEIPVESEGYRTGRVELDARPNGRPFSDRELAALRDAAEQLGGALGPGMGTSPAVDGGSSRASSSMTTGALD